MHEEKHFIYYVIHLGVAAIMHIADTFGLVQVHLNGTVKSA